MHSGGTPYGGFQSEIEAMCDKRPASDLCCPAGTICISAVLPVLLNVAGRSGLGLERDRLVTSSGGSTALDELLGSGSSFLLPSLSWPAVLCWCMPPLTKGDSDGLGST
mmetsp:Transcript_266/g.827  ORF Transcript_266/g.827 Transcript_266/m.827 type:complete len:109 (+) Transcript_266:501-827(+)